MVRGFEEGEEMWVGNKIRESMGGVSGECEIGWGEVGSSVRCVEYL